MTDIRYRVDPRDVPPYKAARRLHLTLDKFKRVLPELTQRGFPQPDPTTGNYFLPDIDRWMESRSNRSPDVSGAITDPAEVSRRIERL
jgi:hypothetical protein